MTVELKTLTNKKYSGNYAGLPPTLDSSSGILVGDLAYDTSITPYIEWKCEINTLGAPLWTPIKELAKVAVTTGLLNGGLITINTDNTKFNISAGKGYINDVTNPALPIVHTVVWNAFTGVVDNYLTTVDETRVAIDVDGNIYQKNVLFDYQDARNYIILGHNLHYSRTYLESVVNAPVLLLSTALTYYNTQLQARDGWTIDAAGNISGKALAETKYDVGLGAVANVDATTTSNITDSSNKRFVTDSELAVLANTSGINTGDQNLSGYVLTSRTVNGHALASNVSVTSYDIGLGAVANVDTTTTSNISDSINKRFVTDSSLLVLANTSGVNTGDQIVPPKITHIDAQLGIVYFDNPMGHQIEVYRYTRKKVGPHVSYSGKIFPPHVGKRYKVLYQLKKNATSWTVPDKWLIPLRNNGNRDRRNHFMFGVRKPDGTRSELSTLTVITTNHFEYNSGIKILLENCGGGGKRVGM